MSNSPSTRAALRKQIAKAEAKGRPDLLAHALKAARERVADAQAMGWKAIEQSWREDVAMLERAIAGMQMKQAA